MTPDSELLARFARTNAEDAFAELVKRHVNLVYSAALRQVAGDAHLAQDVAQTVFTDLARKAGALARRESLTGWLYTSAHFAAAKMVRTETRRRDREETFMREPSHESAPETDWETLRPALDAAMHELKEADREAVLLRYFENRPFAEVGAKLGLNENAARMRVERALEKLRTAFARRGVAATAALASVLSANAVPLAPAGLAATLTTASLVSAGTGTFTLLKIMTATKLKLGISALIVAGMSTALVVQQQAQEKLRGDNAALTQQLAQLETDNESLSNRLAVASEANRLPDEKLNELMKLRGEVTQLRSDAQALATTESATKNWMAKITLLKQKLEQMPDKKIPELQFLTEKDWGNAAWSADLNTEDGIRQALSKLREFAKNTFLNEMMKDAIKKYLATNGGILPTDLSELRPYFEVPVDDVMLQHYKLLQNGKPTEHESLVEEIAEPVDNEYDSWHQISLGGASGSGVNKVQSAIFDAANAFTKDNNGQKPNESSQIVPYLKQPIDAATAQKYFNKIAAPPPNP